MPQLSFHGRLSCSPAPTLHPSALPGTCVGKRSPCPQAGGVLSSFLRPGNRPRGPGGADVLAHRGVFVGGSCPPDPNGGILISLKKTKGKKNRDLKKRPTGWKEVLAPVGFLPLPGSPPRLALPGLARPPSLDTSNQHRPQT